MKTTQRDLMFFVAGALFPPLDFLYTNPFSDTHPFASSWTFWATLLMMSLVFLLLKKASG